MIICILGLSACGKDYISKIISDKYNLNRIVQFTTRPMRSNEIDGIEYNFIDKESFEKMINEDAFISYRVFNSWYYGIIRDCLKFSENSIICIDVEGLEELLEKCNQDNILSIFIEADYDTRKKRAKKRSNFDIDEFNRRYKDDLNKINRIKQKCDYIVDNNNSSDCIPQLCTIFELNL